ncbi:MAG: 50S ribosomal protein L3 [Betaproteobacteria bacterium AqS2]|uniref:Large ribosomal subunit protein uL3 n=1 Tax=Candidatus Amphirhobacter heronislandensis TaxID=1732024 RepID=A0A930UCW2_9GAMM|nr:50S ribosomal protein L3 [Betaproteobacteria bacterium AqS2]
MKTLLGVKIGMSRLFRDDGVAVPVTVLDLSGNRVCQLKKADGPDGYDAVQLAHGARKKKRLSAAAIGHRAKHKAGLARRLKEVRCEAAELEGLESGQELGLDAFAEGLLVDVIGVSKGKGFAGGIRRHNFRSGRASHGTSRAHNTVGSTGQCQDPGRVFKGKKMPGHLGDRGCTVRNLPIARVDLERKLLFVKGGVPGANNAQIAVRVARIQKNGAA